MMQPLSCYCPGHWQQGHHEWVSCVREHCCDQPLCLLSTRLSMWRWYHRERERKNLFDELRVSVPVLKPLLLHVSPLPVKGRLVSCSSCNLGVAARPTRLPPESLRAGDSPGLIIRKKRAEMNTSKATSSCLADKMMWCFEKLTRATTWFNFVVKSVFSRSLWHRFVRLHKRWVYF